MQSTENQKLREAFGYFYIVNGAHERFCKGVEPPPDDSYDEGTLVPVYRATLPTQQSAVDSLKDAFKEGYCARSTYNDVDISDVETEWAKSSTKASIHRRSHAKGPAMSYKLYPIKYEIYDHEVGVLCATIECNDEATSTVQVLDKIHTAESFEELSVKIIEALQLMHPKEDV